MPYPPHYSHAIGVLRRLESLIERDLPAAEGDRRRVLLEMQRRTQSAIASPMLLADIGFALRAADQARRDLDTLNGPAGS